MKTSKKLLSFFLAVVMIVSSCSVGFTAFAKDDTDANRDYWNNASEASDAFGALNNLIDAYLPMLLNDPSIKPQIENALGITITNETKISDLVAGASPLLVGALSSSSKQTVIPNYNMFSDASYAYLDSEPGKGMDFYKLYNFCKTMDDKIPDPGENEAPTDQALINLNAYSKATLVKLNKLLSTYNDIKNANTVDGILNTPEGYNAAASIFAGPIREIMAYGPLAIYWYPEQLEQIVINYNGVPTKIADIPFKSDDPNVKSDYELFAAPFNAYYKSIGSDKYIDSFADLISYGFSQYTYPALSGGNNMTPLMMTLNTLQILTSAGVKVSTEPIGGTSDVTFDFNDYQTVIKGVYTLDNFLADNGSTKEQYDSATPDDKAKYDAGYEHMINEKVSKCLYQNRKRRTSLQPNHLDFTSTYYMDMCKALVKMQFPDFDIDAAIANEQITDEQLLAVSVVASEQQWSNDVELDAYIGSDACVFSNSAKKLFATLAAVDKDTLSRKLVELGDANEADKASVLADLKAILTTDTEVAYYGGMPIIDRINLSVPSMICQDKFGSSLNYMRGYESAFPSIDLIYSEIKNSKAIPQIIKDSGIHYDYNDYKVAVLDDGTQIELTNEMMVDAVNLLINNIIDVVFSGDLSSLGIPINLDINGIVNSLLTTPVELHATLQNLWKDLYNNPVATIFNLAPLLTILIDELILPIIFTENDTQMALSFNQLLAGMLFSPEDSGIGAPLYKYTLAAGDKQIGVVPQTNTKGLLMFSFNLNKILPSILDYILDVPNSQFVSSLPTYGSIVDANGNMLANDYDKDVPMFTNILAADREIAKVVVGDKLVALLTDNLYNSALTKATANGATVTEEQKAAMQAEAAENAKGLNEIIKTVGTTLNGAVHDYFADGHGDEIRYMKNGSSYVINQRGLNNLFVSVPQLVDYLGKSILTKYEIGNSDWTALYDGKIVNTEIASQIFENRNSTNDAFKALAAIPSGLEGQALQEFKENNSAAILEQVLNIAIGNWMNGLIDYINDIVSDTSANNKIVNELPLVFGLLDAIGGLGERSVISDLVDGLFQLKRTDENSFAITEQPITKYKGFSNKAGLFLISNLQFQGADGQQRGLIPLIMNIAGNGASTTSATKSLNAAALAKAAAPYVSNSKAVQARAALNANDKAALLSNNKAAADKLVKKLDQLLSTLLSDITVNGKNITEISNFATDIATMLTPALGEQNATNLVNNVIVAYLNIIKNGTYDSNTLSEFVVNTYDVIEDIVDYMFYAKDAAPLAKDTDKLLGDAITGIISPDSVSVRLTGGATGAYSATFAELQKKDNLRWQDFKATQDGGTKNVLKFNVNGEDAFFEAMAESFGGISAIFGAVLRRAVTIDSTPDNIKNLYSEVYYPLFGNLLTGVMKPEVYNNPATLDSARLAESFIKPVNELLKNLTKVGSQPATELLNLVASLGGVLGDANIAKIVDGLLGVIDDELDGFTNIVGNLSKTFQAKLKNMINTFEFDMGGSKQTIPGLENMIRSFVKDENGNVKNDILVNILNALLVQLAGVELPTIDWALLNSKVGKPGETLLLIFNYAVTAVTTEPVLQLILQNKYPGLVNILKDLTAAQIIDIINQIIDEVQSPTEMYWAFTQYASKLKGEFVYPQGILPQDATNAVAQLDNIVKNIFPLLKELGVLNSDSLAALLNDMAFTNANLTTLAKSLYGALNGKIGNTSISIADITKAFGVDPTPAGVAACLMDTSYGATFSSAAQTLNSVNSWNDVKTINWGFTDGSGMAQTGFINGLAAILRPLDGILAMLLANGQLTVDTEGLVATINSINTKLSDTVTLANGVITIVSGNNNVQIALANTAREIATIINDGKIHVTSNAYESAIIPLLEAFTIDGFKTYKDYLADYRNAKDNLLLNILNPLMGFVNKVVDAPFDTLTAVLPNVALFIDGYGVSQFLNNLLAPIVSDNGIVGILNKNGINIDTLIAEILGTDLATYIQSDKVLNANVGLQLKLTDLEQCNIHEVLIPIVNSLLASKGIKLNNIDWKQLAGHGEIKVVPSAAKNADGQYTTRQIVNVNKGETLIGLLRYISNVLINNAKSINKLVGSIDAIKSNATLKSILGCIFDQIDLAQTDDIIRAIFFFLLDEGDNSYFDYTGFTYEEFEFSFGNMDEDFCRQLGPMLDGLVGGMINLNEMVTSNVYKDDIISTIATGLYKAVEGVNISKEIGSLTHLLSLTGIDFTTTNVANLLVDEAYGQSYEDAAKTIKAAGSWANVKAENLKWGVTDRDSFLHALAAVLRPVYGVLDVLLNNGSLNIFNLVSIPGSDGYTSFLVPLMEAIGLYNIKTQYQYREDIFNAYDNILLDVLNPLLDKVEDILNAPIETLTDMLPNLALVFANGGLLQIIDNLLTPVSAILNAIRPIVDANKLLDALNVDIPGMLAKVGIKGNFTVDVYDLPATLTPLLGAASVTDLLNGVLSTIKVGGAPLGVVLPQINWYQLASHGEVILDGTSQVACNGMRISVKADQDETLIALLRFIINTVNYENNYDAICGLIGGLIGGADASVSDMVGQVLGMLQGDADAVIEDIVSLLQDLAG